MTVNGRTPTIASDVYIAEGAFVIGDVTIGEGSSVWFNAVLRGDTAPIVIGRYTNIQECCSVHVERGKPTIIGDYVSIGHNAVVHGARLEDNVLVAIHATVLSGATVGAGSLIGTGALVGENAVIPPRSLVLGIPGKVVKELTEDAVLSLRAVAERYHGYARDFLTTGRLIP